MWTTGQIICVAGEGSLQYRPIKSEVKFDGEKLNDTSHKTKFDIVESKKIETLHKFKENGFAISYWLPNYHFFGVLSSSFMIKNNIIKYKPTAISCDYNSLHFYLKKFPNYSINCWTNELNSEKDKQKIINLAKNENIKIILVDFKNNFLITR